MADTRFPRSVYGKGEEPDARFSLANERTFLSWISTSLSLVATGVALEYFGLPKLDALRYIAVAIFLALGIISAVRAVFGWGATEISMRQKQRLPGMGLSSLLGIGVALAGVVVAIGVFIK